jgi:SAM-dependent methyltransferase
MTDDPPDRAHWTRFAAEWTAWARAPGHDAFWSCRDAFVEFVGAGTGSALDIGCGEGRISRELKALGYCVTASDAVAEMVAAAKDWDSAHVYAGADALPFAAASFDLAVAYNVLMDVEDVPAALRVLRPDGTLIISIVHPIFDHGRFNGDGPDAAFVMEASYIGRQRFESTLGRDGLTMHFAGWSQPLEVYVDALAAAGLAITSLREPQPKFDGTDERLRQFERVRCSCG